MYNCLTEIKIFIVVLLSYTLCSGCASVNQTSDISGIPHPSRRMEQIRQIGKAAPKLDSERQQKYAETLTAIIREETDCLVRREAVLALANFPCKKTEETLKSVMRDSDRDIRLAACSAWATYGGQISTDALITMLNTENDLDIRLECIELLGKSGDKRAVKALAGPLSETDPAMRHYAVTALQQITGFNTTSEKEWLAYCRGETDKPQEIAWYETILPH